MPNTQSDADRGLLGTLESVLKLGTAILALVAAIGLPAVAVHLVGFGVPVGLASYQDVIRAGVLPAVVLAVVILYCVASAKALTRMSLAGFLGLHSFLLLPLIVAAYLVFLVGTFSYAVLAVYWLIFWPTRKIFPSIQISNREMLMYSAAIVSVVAVVVLVLMLTRKLWIWRDGWVWAALRSLFDLRKGEPPTERGEVQGEAAAATAKSTENVPSKPAAPAKSAEPESKWLWLIIGVSMMGMLLLLTYSTKWLLSIWDPPLGDALLPHRYVIYVVLGCGTVFLVFFGGIALTSTSSSGKASPRTKTVIIVLAAIVYVVFEIAYSMWGYQRLHRGLGGGRPEPATLWLKQDDKANDIAAVLKGAEIKSAGSLRRVDRVFVVLDGEKELLISDTPSGPGKAVLLSKVRLMAVSW